MANLTPSGYRSATEYQFDQDQSDAIVRTTAYNRKDYCLSVIWFSPREHAKIRPSIATPFQRTSHVGLGALDRLPLELLFDTLYHLDMRSLFKLRQVCLRSRQVVDSLNQYQRVVSYGLNLLCVLLRTQIAKDITLLEFDNALGLKTCALCGAFGGFMFLLTWKRCCFKCLQCSPETQVRTLASVRKRLHVPKADIDQLRSFKCLPGIYSMNETVQNSRIALVSLYQATLSCEQNPHAIARAQRAVLDQKQKFNFMGACALPYVDRQTRRVECGISCAGCQLAIERDVMGSTRGTKWGYYEARDKVYAEDEFLDHFRWCEHAQRLWRSSGEGENRPPELPVFVLKGGYFRWRD